jgi:uncharacterized protein (DUF1501 family)
MTMLDSVMRARASRRSFLLAGGAAFGAAYQPKIARAAGGRDPRLVVIVLRGALDGLSAVAPVADPDYAGLHGAIALSTSGANPGLPLDSFFALNPGMPVFARMFRDKTAAVVHAVATGYRDRSHFDGQDVLESGFANPGHTTSGWLNRAIAELPKGDRAAINGGLGVGAVTPLIMRGAAPVVGWAPTALPQAEDDLAMRLMELYQHTDPALAVSLGQGLGIEKIAAREMGGQKPQGGNEAQLMRRVGEGVARLIAPDDGPRIAALAFDGWDTHANEGGATGRLAQLLGGLDGAFEAFEQTLGPAWKDTAIVVITEFGRTARVNGTTGTDHGTGTVAFLAGGAVRGGRVIADWPGLKDGQLFQNRDLKPTTDLRAVLKGLLADQFGLSAIVLGSKVFPESIGIAPMKGLTA